MGEVGSHHKYPGKRLGEQKLRGVDNPQPCASPVQSSPSGSETQRATPETWDFVLIPLFLHQPLCHTVCLSPGQGSVCGNRGENPQAGPSPSHSLILKSSSLNWTSHSLPLPLGYPRRKLTPGNFDARECARPGNGGVEKRVFSLNLVKLWLKAQDRDSHSDQVCLFINTVVSTI